VEPRAALRRYATQESAMPYALFENDAQLSRSFPTEAEVWEHADNAGLVVDDNGKLTLEDSYVIKPCAAAPGEQTHGDDWQLPKIKSQAA
jgi:hypothetical protein